MSKLTLISSPTCPYVQRAVIALKEKGVPFDVVYVDLANKPDWFLAISPLGKVPLLKIEREGKEDAIVFESAVILEYLEETAPGKKLHPADPLERAQHRSWIEYGTSVLSDLWKFSSALNGVELAPARAALEAKFKRLESTVVGPFFAGAEFSYVDAVFGPVFRQIDAIDSVTPTGLLEGFPKVKAWGDTLLSRESIKTAVPADYREVYLARLFKQDAEVLKKAA